MKAGGNKYKALNNPEAIGDISAGWRQDLSSGVTLTPRTVEL